MGQGGSTIGILRLGLPLALVACALALPASAAAQTTATVSLSGGTITVSPVDHASCDRGLVTIDVAGNDYEFVAAATGDGACGDIDPGGGCSDQGLEAVCPTEDVTQFVLGADPDGQSYDIEDSEAPIAFDLNGGVGEDVIFPTVSGDSMPGADTLDGGDGDDELSGGDGGDVINGGADNDDIDGGDGGDTIDAGADADGFATGTNVLGGAGIDDIDGGSDSGADELRGGADGDTIGAGAGADTLLGEAGNDTLNGDAGNDTLDGGQNSAAPQDTDTLNGGADDDQLRNSEGSDDFNGGAHGAVGDEVDYSLTAGSAGIVADIDNASGDDGRAGEGDSVGGDVENLTGDDGGDGLIGSAQANDIDGADGFDILRGGAGPGPDGADSLVGGSGIDHATYSNRTDSIAADLDGVADDGAGGCPGAAGCEDDDLDTTVENLSGGSGDDVLTGGTGDNGIAGGAGDDELRGGAGPGPDGADDLNGGSHVDGDLASYDNKNSFVSVSIADAANDGAGGCPNNAGCEDDEVASDVEDLEGTGATDDLIGDADANELFGGGGDDRLIGGPGPGPDAGDAFHGGADLTSGDTVQYLNRTDNLTAAIGGAGADPGETIDTGVENITGGTGNDFLTGDSDVNDLRGGGGDDTLRGGAGTGPDGADVFDGGAHTAAGDTVSYSNRTDPVGVAPGGGADEDGDDVQATIENLTGGSGDDTLTGDGDPNTITGGLGADAISSFGGADLIEAVDGIADTIDCGSESDIANVDLGLDVAGLCEQVTQPPVTPPGGGQGGQGGQGSQGAQQKKCKKGQKRRKVKGKVKCVKKRKRKA